MVASIKWLVLILAGFITAQLRRLLKKITYIEYKLIATDYALERSLKNGYADHRNEKLNELIQKDNFINKNGKNG